MPREVKMAQPHTTLYFLVMVMMVVMVVVGAQILTHPHTPRNYDPCTTSSHGVLHRQWDRIPVNFTITSSCLRVVIDELCKNNFPDVSPEDIGIDKDFNRGIMNCQGANCSIECIHQTYCNKRPDMEMPTESVAQEVSGFLPQTFNSLPKCSRYLKGLNQTVFMKDAGEKCWGKLQCICGMCCESSTQEEVMRRMLDQTYKDLQAHLRSQPTWGRTPSRPSFPGHGTRAKPRVVAYARPGRH